MEHDFMVWGTICECGNECSVLQNQNHPWNDTKFTIQIVCPICKRKLTIDKNLAKKFHNNKI